jgi:hypothetical protein
VVVAVELSRLLRRALLVAGVALAGWLLSLVFASVASADEAPPDDTTHTDGLVSGLVGGLTDTLGGVADRLGGTWVDTSGDAAPDVMPEPDPILDLPSILPSGSSSGSSSSGSSSSGSASGSAATDRNDVVPQVADVAAAPPPAPVAPAPAPPPAPVVVRTPEPAPAPRPVVSVPAAPPVAQDPGGNAAEQAGNGDPEPQPVKSPPAPASSGTTVSASHDSSGGARGTHGVLPAQASLHPADAGFTTRSRAVDAAGRSPGLPATSPD